MGKATLKSPIDGVCVHDTRARETRLKDKEIKRCEKRKTRRGRVEENEASSSGEINEGDHVRIYLAESDIDCSFFRGGIGRWIDLVDATRKQRNDNRRRRNYPTR